MFNAIFVTAFFGFFRVNELVANSHSDIGHASSSEDVYISGKGVEVLLKHSKTDQKGKGTLILLPRVKAGICPVKAISEYMSIRTKCKGLFFVHANGVHVTRYQFNAVLKMGLEMKEVDGSNLRAHSFRTTACLVGLSEDEIKGLGH